MNKRNTIRIGMFGNEYFKRVVGNLIKEELGYIVTYDGNTREIDIAYCIGGPGPLFYKNLRFWFSRAKLIYIHWIGTDVLNVLYPSRKKALYMRLFDGFTRLFFIKKRIINLAVTEWLAQELTALGYSVWELAITTVNLSLIQSNLNHTNKTIDFLAYAPLGRFEFYGGNKIIEIAKLLPEYSFLIISTDLDQHSMSLPNHPNNVAFSKKVTYEEMQHLYEKTKCFLRLTQHDGLCASVLEALYHGLQVFWTYPFPHTRFFKSVYHSLPEMVESIKNWEPNIAGHHYIVEHYTTDQWKNNFLAVIDKTYYCDKV